MLGVMNARIEFLQDITETTLPIIQVTKSKNGKTGTATFLFLKPFLFTIFEKNKQPIQFMNLKWEKKSMSTNDIVIFFFKGKPTFLKSTFLFRNSKEWFDFFHFMQQYSKKTGLYFEEKKVFF